MRQGIRQGGGGGAALKALSKAVDVRAALGGRTGVEECRESTPERFSNVQDPGQ